MTLEMEPVRPLMPPIEAEGRVRSAVYWPKVGEDHHSQTLIGPPVQLQVRWTNRRIQTTDANGNPVTIEASLILDRPVLIGSIMWKGKLDEWANTGDLMEIVDVNEVDDLRGIETRYTATLRRYRKSLPAMAPP